MPYGMGRHGWFCWPPWEGFWHPGNPYPYWPPVWPLSPADEEAILTRQAESLEAELRQIRERLEELKKIKKEKEEKKK
jgi:hypothetical protein